MTAGTDAPPAFLPEGTDWLGAKEAAARPVGFWDASPMEAAGIVRPATTNEVAAILKACSEQGQTVVTHGGRTGCADGTRSRSSDLVLSFERMNRIIEIDAVEGVVVVEAGCVLETLQGALAERGLFLPLDLGARGSCTVGGNVATNAGGVNVIRYGMTRNLVLGLEAVLADGTVLSSLDRVLKNNAGYDLKQLFVGTEGTLGVVTKIVFRVQPLPAARRTALAKADSFSSVLKLLSLARARLRGDLAAFEAMWGSYYDAVTAEGGHRAPVARGGNYYVLIETEGAADDEAGAFETFLEEAFSEELIKDGALASSERERADFWRVRDDFEAITNVPRTYLYDVSMPLRTMEVYAAAVGSQLGAEDPGASLHIFGHIGDGNLHLFISTQIEGDAGRHLADRAVYEPLKEVGGSVSAEHGIGREKKPWLGVTKSAAEIAVMRSLKTALDPGHILNPGVVFDSPPEGPPDSSPVRPRDSHPDSPPVSPLLKHSGA